MILGLGWTFPCDLWSCGCILVELATGDALFQVSPSLSGFVTHCTELRSVALIIPASGPPLSPPTRAATAGYAWGAYKYAGDSARGRLRALHLHLHLRLLVRKASRGTGTAGWRTPLAHATSAVGAPVPMATLR